MQLRINEKAVAGEAVAFLGAEGAVEPEAGQIGRGANWQRARKVALCVLRVPEACF